MGRSSQLTREEQVAARQPENSTLGLGGQLVLKDHPDERPTVASMGGRTLYGGGGITPDLAVLPDTLTLREQHAVQRVFRSAGVFWTSLFNHAVAYVPEHPDLERGFEARGADLDAFYRFLVEESQLECGPAA